MHTHDQLYAGYLLVIFLKVSLWSSDVLMCLQKRPSRGMIIRGDEGRSRRMEGPISSNTIK